MEGDPGKDRRDSSQTRLQLLSGSRLKTPSHTLSEQLFGNLSLRRAFVHGIIAAVLVFGLTVAVATVANGGAYADTTGTLLVADPGWIDYSGWLFFATHFVETGATVTYHSGWQLTGSYDLLSQQTALPPIVYRLLPVGVLAVLGYRYATVSLDQHARSGDGFYAGMLLAWGYLPAVVAGLVIFTHENAVQVGTAISSPDVIPGVLFAGIFYPVVFGGLGGYLSRRLP